MQDGAMPIGVEHTPMSGAIADTITHIEIEQTRNAAEHPCPAAFPCCGAALDSKAH
jgi:hypothetical protein